MKDARPNRLFLLFYPSGMDRQRKTRGSVAFRHRFVEKITYDRHNAREMRVFVE
jgi:hypothetical protein